MPSTDGFPLPFEDTEWGGWVQAKPVVTTRFFELDDPEGYLGPSFQVGVAWYDRPDGTTDL